MLKFVIALVMAFSVLVGFTYIIIPLALWGVIEMIRMIRRQNRTRSNFFSENFQYVFDSGKTGIAVAPDKRLVKLKEKSKVKEYPFEMIRSWNSNLQSGGMAVHGGSSLTGATNVGAANLGQSIANRRASGFFVNTKDIDNATWRIEMFDEKEQAKWMEIMQQCVNET